MKKLSNPLFLKNSARFLFLCGLSLCVSVSLPAQEPPSEHEALLTQAQKHFTAGKDYSSEGDYTRANEEFKKAEQLLEGELFSSGANLPLLPFDVPLEEVRMLLDDAQSAASNDNTKLAIQIYLEALSLFPEHPAIHYNLALQYLKQENYWDAARELVWVIRLNPYDKEAYYNLGILYEIFLGNDDLALTYYRKYLELAPLANDRAVVSGWIETLEKKSYERR
jgi:tetratricopeptide (TPR) repeat protein